MPESTSRAAGFSDEESFGLFMEAIRTLQIYEEEADRIQSDPGRLEAYALEAVDTLEQCTQQYPEDLLPRYYLGIALTIQNQRTYAERLRQGVDRDVEQGSTGIRLGRLHDLPWPLLEQALECFDHREEYALVPEFRQTAQFNRANVYARLGTDAALTSALDILDALRTPGEPPPAGTFDFLSTLVNRRQQARQQDEARAFELGALILRAVVLALRAIVRQRKRAETVALVDVKAAPVVAEALADLTRLLTRAGVEVKDSIARHDLMADALTKRGLVRYSSAVLERPWDDAALNGAVADFSEALQHKANWIPARTYLAQTYQALGCTDEAEQQFTAILGKKPAAVAAA